MFIVFEGLDGSGSTTQAKLLVENLKSKNIRAIHTCEPTENTIGKLIRGALQKKWQTSPEALQLLFTADRADHLFAEVEPEIEKGNIVVSDRYFWSTIAYGALACDQDWLAEMNQIFRKPDFTFLLKVPAKVCVERIQQRGQDIELFEEEQKLEKVWQVFEKLAAKEENVMILNGEKSMKEIAEEVWRVLEEKFSEKLA